ncbi:hypothetical protein SAMN05444398_102224 [Roseovarius pacificus]|uniref:Uncharacterized protein n=1 Tax=Roseovarius pacificus TaxID=337701 RepID=A0A1M7A9A6_9RHOB|nr:hypothetical protein [Roseovarius pacificus]GGO53751.1 hypothetical protein GCM10011315_12310 [Roseovarius pacificus]SHL39169.1 hypothetical protein SAMN05444398_102224 [Roseovarius pacificus]
MPNLEHTLLDGLNDPEAGWNMGSFGAIAEFHHVAADPRPPVAQTLEQITDRGGLRIDTLDGVRPVAYETLSPKPHRWTQAIALCLPSDAAGMTRRDVLTELGPDNAALRPQDRDAVLFDMGLAQPQVDFCIRTDDADLLTVLRAHAGQSLFAPDNPAMGAILRAHPHRVALTRLGRVEVYQMIGGPDTGGASPEGPHTHVLPKLLRAERTHSANTPIPEGWVPCAGFHPNSPVLGRLGEDKDFDAQAFDRFQKLLAAWGPDDYVTQKSEVWDALDKGLPPESWSEPGTRLARTGLRNAIRQWRRQHGESDLIAAWARAFDKGEADAEPENPGH